MSQPLSVYFYCADQNTHRDRSRGITRYSDGLISHLAREGTVRPTAIVSKSSIEAPAGAARVALPLRTDHVLGRLIGDHLHPLLISDKAADLWHYPKGFLPGLVRRKKPTVGTVADVMLQFEADHHPESRSRAAFTYWLGVLRRSIQQFDLILTVSEFSKRDIQTFCERHRITCPPIVVTYQGVEVATRPEQLPRAKSDHVLHLASNLPYKATTWLLEQWLTRQSAGGRLPPLRLVGSLDARGKELLGKLHNVSLEPPLPRAQLEEGMARAGALLLPSEIEGFGIPAVEAYLLGTPVAYAKGTALEEIVGFGSPGGFERNAESLEDAIEEVLQLDQAWVTAKAAELRARFSWENCVRLTIEGYRSIL